MKVWITFKHNYWEREEDKKSQVLRVFSSEAKAKRELSRLWRENGSPKPFTYKGYEVE